MPAGTSVQAAAPGEVALISEALGGLGTIVLVRHRDDLITTYSTLSDVRVSEGQQVQAGTVLGVVADRENPELQFDVFRGTDERRSDPVYRRLTGADRLASGEAVDDQAGEIAVAGGERPGRGGGAGRRWQGDGVPLEALEPGGAADRAGQFVRHTNGLRLAGAGANGGAGAASGPEGRPVGAGAAQDDSDHRVGPQPLHF